MNMLPCLCVPPSQSITPGKPVHAIVHVASLVAGGAALDAIVFRYTRPGRLVVGMRRKVVRACLTLLPRQSSSVSRRSHSESLQECLASRLTARV